MTSLITLPQDVVLFHLLEHLNTQEVLNLAATCKHFFWLLSNDKVRHLLYCKSFPVLSIDETGYDSFYKWGPGLYRLQSQQNFWGLYLDTFGTDASRYFQDATELRATYITHFGDTVRNEFRKQIIHPVDRVSDICVSCFSFLVLTPDGGLYHMAGPYGEQLKNGGSGLYTYGLREKLMKRGQKLVAIAAGRNHFIALDRENVLWVWDDSGAFTNDEVSLRLVDSSGSVISGHVSKIRAGGERWGSCLLEDKIIIWKNPWHRETPPLPLEKEYTSQRMAAVIEVSEVQDYLVLDTCLVYQTTEGKFFIVDLRRYILGVELPDILQSYPLEQLNNLSLKVVRLSGWGNKLSLVTDSHHVFIASTKDFRPIEMRDLASKRIISVSFGENQTFALAKDGVLYSWGRGNKETGLLCFQDLEGLSKKGLAFPVGCNMVIPRPVRVPIGGVIVALASGGSLSAILFGDDKER